MIWLGSINVILRRDGMAGLDLFHSMWCVSSPLNESVEFDSVYEYFFFLMINKDIEIKNFFYQYTAYSHSLPLTAWHALSFSCIFNSRTDSVGYFKCVINHPVLFNKTFDH